ncbi:hypothetical protein POF50_032915 [Streptomyces sp. SL13]|jgi:hypothetical protein|uniref:DUF2231 domain-containing protein n=1 Tax=Streptantibioticus silvisoli TaxID=2705255 RepID=A0AA90HFP7_9ACTN|nr:DUF2231 domain-containing protein [Streptantibioticus silvisoli]MDI5967301.1 hypothetical protein [Streptantibioticus silvisoli]MDI5974092.1 hypothetical protein [Streptantibioticus silvisoli]
MGPVLVNGLPAHALLVHAVVILVPLAALALVVCALLPSWTRRLGIVLPGLALVALVSVPLTTHAGEWLKRHVPADPLVNRHADLGDTLLPWVIALFVVGVAVWWFGRRMPFASETARPVGWTSGTAMLSVPVRIAAIVLSLVVGVGSVVQVYRIGDSGAKAVWHDSFSAKPVNHS